MPPVASCINCSVEALPTVERIVAGQALKAVVAAETLHDIVARRAGQRVGVAIADESADVDRKRFCRSSIRRNQWRARSPAAPGRQPAATTRLPPLTPNWPPALFASENTPYHRHRDHRRQSADHRADGGGR